MEINEMEIVEDEISSNQNPPTNVASQSFLDRKNLLTNELEKLEAEAQLKLRHSNREEDVEFEYSTQLTPQRQNRKRSYKEMRHLVGRESIFKRPEAPISKCLPVRTQPDFKVNPHKWKKYSLEDVTPEDMSNRQNTASALAFLRELEERKRKEIDDQRKAADIDNDFKPVFKRTSFNKSAIVKKAVQAESNENDDNKPKFKSTTLVMPEYRVGERKKKEKKIKSTKEGENRKELKLSHLLEPDEQEDDDNE